MVKSGFIEAWVSYWPDSEDLGVPVISVNVQLVPEITMLYISENNVRINKVVL